MCRMYPVRALSNSLTICSVESDGEREKNTRVVEYWQEPLIIDFYSGINSGHFGPTEGEDIFGDLNRNDF